MLGEVARGLGTENKAAATASGDVRGGVTARADGVRTDKGEEGASPSAEIGDLACGEIGLAGRATVRGDLTRSRELECVGRNCGDGLMGAARRFAADALRCGAMDATADRL